MNFAKTLLVCTSLCLGVTTHTGGVLLGGHDLAARAETWPRHAGEGEVLQPSSPLNLLDDAMEQLPRLRFDGTLKTVEEYMAHAHARYLETVKSQGGPRALKDTPSLPEAKSDIRYHPGVLADSEAEDERETQAENEIPKGPCLEGTPDFLCTVQLVPGGKRHIVSRKELEDDLQEANESYSGFSLPFCCSGRASRIVLD